MNKDTRQINEVYNNIGPAGAGFAKAFSDADWRGEAKAVRAVLKKHGIHTNYYNDKSTHTRRIAMKGFWRRAGEPQPGSIFHPVEHINAEDVKALIEQENIYGWEQEGNWLLKRWKV